MKRLFTTLLVLSTAGSAHAVTEISSCTDITLAGTAVITQDLDCTADQLQITITPFGILDFQGHTVLNAKVLCTAPNDANCNILGPGTLQGTLASWDTIRVRGLDLINGKISAGRATIKETTITGAFENDCAIRVETNYASSLKIVDTVVTGAYCGVLSIHNTTIRNSKFLNTTYGGVRVYWGGFNAQLRIKDSEFSGNGTFGVVSDRLSVKNSKFNDNGEHGIFVYSIGDNYPGALSIRGCEATGNEVGIEAGDHRSNSISGCTITGNTRRGLSMNAHRAKVRDSTITGNGFAPECDDPETRCADLVSWYEPTLSSDTTCDTSLSWTMPTQNWGVCSTD